MHERQKERNYQEDKEMQMHERKKIKIKKYLTNIPTKKKQKIIKKRKNETQGEVK